MDLKDLQTLKKKLPRGTITVLANEFNITRQAVNKILNGKSKNANVIESAIIIAEKAAKKEQNLKERIKNL